MDKKEKRKIINREGKWRRRNKGGRGERRTDTQAKKKGKQRDRYKD